MSLSSYKVYLQLLLSHLKPTSRHFLGLSRRALLIYYIGTKALLFTKYIRILGMQIPDFAPNFTYELPDSVSANFFTSEAQTKKSIVRI